MPFQACADFEDDADTHEGYKGHGVYVPDGLHASWIMEGAWALEREFDVAPFISRQMVRSVLAAILPLLRQDGTSQRAFVGDEGGSQLGASR
jgi:hypothetical protein